MSVMGKAENSPNQYQIGGSLRIDAPSYVERQADKDFYLGLKSGEYCYVLNSRQMGKSSLRVQTMGKLQADGIACGVIDITAIGSQDITPAEWYLGLVRRLARSFTPKVNVLTWWKDYEGLSPVERLNEFIESVLLTQVTQNIVIFVDEIDSILKLNFKADFLALLRACYNKRGDNPAYQRLTFALLGVATPYDLITDKNRTPFNVGRAIQLSGFQEHEAQPLAQGLIGKVINPQAILKEVLAWTGGQPFLTQKLCKLVITSDLLMIPGDEPKFVQALVQSGVIENWESQDEPEHLKTIRDRIVRSQQRAVTLLKLYQQILLQGEITADSSPEQMELRLSGLVIKQLGSLRVYNRIYASVFNLRWLEKTLLQLIPDGSAIEAWVASNSQEKSHLLRGQILQKAPVWSQGKIWSTQKEQFLAASAELETQQQPITFPRLKNWNQGFLLKRSFSSVIILSVVITILVLGMRQLGNLQNWELQAFDHLMQLRSDEQPDPRLLIVAISEEDFKLPEQRHRTGSLSDQALSQVLDQLEQYKPRAIGLDIYRDFAVDSKQADLATKMQRNENLFAICKVSDPEFNQPAIAPPPEIPQKRQGFSDFVDDPDGVVRRHLLAMKSESISACTSPYAFSSQLAFHYLESLGIFAKYTETKELQIGKVVFKPLRNRMGGYQQIDARGYQILLNYRSSGSPLKVAEQVTLKDILYGKVKSSSIHNRIILIGITAHSAGDYFSTPYSTSQRFYQQIPGVVIHAQMVSQILSATLDGRPLLWVWNPLGEALWIWGWSLFGGILAWQIHKPWQLALTAVMALGILSGLSFQLLTSGVWVPLIPSELTLLLTASVVFAATHRE
jgi:CHASE2 domain-containing sensor protein